MSKIIPLPPFKAFLASNIPSVYDNTLSYYDELTKLIAYMEELVPAVNANTEGLAELKKYVENYFDNLDVQEEINNKLDAMAESGQLAEYIAQYADLPCVHAYDTIADMASSESLVSGSFARAMSKTVAGTGDGAYYKIRKTVEGDNPDGTNLVAITGTTLVAEIIPDANLETLGETLINAQPINAKLNGVVGDGETDDTLAIQALIDNGDRKSIYFPAGSYLISDTIKIKQGASDIPDLIFDPKAKIFTNTSLDYLIEYTAENEPSTTSFARLVYHQFEGGLFDGNNIDVAVICADSLARDIHFNNVNIIRNSKVGLWLKLNNSFRSGGATVENLYVSGMSSAIDGNIGILNDSYDNEFFNIRTCGTQIGIQTSAGGHFTNAHPLYAHTTTPTATEFNKSIGFKITSGADVQTTFIDCYPDGFATGWDIANSWSRNTIIKGYHNFSVAPMTGAEVSFVYLHQPNIILNLFDCRFDPSDPGGGVSSYVAHNIRVDGDMNTFYLDNMLQMTNCRWAIKPYIPDDDPSYALRTGKISSCSYLDTPYSTNMESGKWYKFALINVSQTPQRFILDMASDGTWMINIKWSGGLSSGSAVITKTDISGGLHNYTLGIIDGYVKNNVVYGYLAIKTTDVNVAMNATIHGIQSGSNGDIFMTKNKYGMTGINTPTSTTATLELNA